MKEIFPCNKNTIYILDVFSMQLSDFADNSSPSCQFFSDIVSHIFFLPTHSQNFHTWLHVLDTYKKFLKVVSNFRKKVKKNVQYQRTWRDKNLHVVFVLMLIIETRRREDDTAQHHLVRVYNEDMLLSSAISCNNLLSHLCVISF